MNKAGVSRTCLFLVLTAICLVPFPLAAQTARKIPDLVKITADLPDFVMRTPVKNDTLYAYGAAIGSDLDQSLAIAETHANQDLVRMMVEGIPTVADYIKKIKGGVWDASFIQILLLADQHIMDALTYTGVTAIERREQTPDGAVWYLVSLKKADAIKIITNTDRLLR
jgi:hypothetical protein